jgi:exosortase/archaeosortase family protein
MLPALALFLTIVPPPLAVTNWAVNAMQQFTLAQVSDFFTAIGIENRILNIYVVLLGPPRQSLEVVRSCSGINDLVVVMSACVFYLGWKRVHWHRYFLVLPLALATTLLFNLVRITFGGWLRFQYGVNLFAPGVHDVCGLLFTALSLASIFGWDKVFAALGSWLHKPVAALLATAAIGLNLCGCSHLRPPDDYGWADESGDPGGMDRATAAELDFKKTMSDNESRKARRDFYNSVPKTP